jgi:hypothetical protein
VRYGSCMPAPVSPLPLEDTDRQQVRQWVSAFGTPQQVVLRWWIVLAATEGESDHAIAQRFQINRKTVTLWRTRCLHQGVKSLWEIAPGRGRKPTYGPEKVQAIVDATLRIKSKGRTQWSCRSLAARQGIRKSTVSNMWRGHNLKPHRVQTFQLARDPRFLEKWTAGVGLDLNPPEQAIVLGVDEKSPMQAWDRTPPGLPRKKGRCGTLTHDDQRHGTTTLFAALELLPGKVMGQGYQRHRHQEFLKFLRQLEQAFPAHLSLHWVMDNSGTHQTAEVRTGLQRHPRFVLPFVPTSSSGWNLVERWFRELTTACVRRGVFCSVADLERAIVEFLTAWNEEPKPFVWVATVESIGEKLSRCRQTLEPIQPGSTLPRTRKTR